MSTIRVDTIQSTSTTDGGISIDSSGNITLPANTKVGTQNLPSAGPLSNRNLIINGAMQVAQRGTSTTGITGTAFGGPDRFRLAVSSHGTYTLSQESSVVPDGFSNALKVECTTADTSVASGSFALIRYHVEAQDCQHLKFGTASPESVTLSFWVRSSKTGTYTYSLEPDDAGLNNGKTFTIDTADTWEYKTLTYSGYTNSDSSTQIANDNGVGLELQLWLAAGSNFTSGTFTDNSYTSTTADRVSSSNVNFADTANATFYLTGVQLEVGSVATPFEHRSFAYELEKCKRYYQNAGNVCYGIVEGTTLFRVQIPLYPVMRTTPSSVVRSGGKFNVRFNGDTTITDPTVQDVTNDAQSVWLGVQSTGLTANRAVFGRSQQDDTGNFLGVSAEF